jgi:hypothetical protein
LAENAIRAEGAKRLSAVFSAVLNKGHKPPLAVLDISSNEIGAYSEDNDGRAPWIASPEGPAAVADAIRGMRALSIANVMGNRIGRARLSELQEIVRSENAKLVSLCGIADDATEADLSGLGMDADDAIVLASELPDKRAMTSLNLASNEIEEKFFEIIAACYMGKKCT